MKCTIIIDPEREEEVIVYAHEHNSFTEQIEALSRSSSGELIGYSGKKISVLPANDIYAVSVEDGKVFAVTKAARWQIYERLYRAEELLGDSFVKINQSCIVNVKYIDRFDTTIGASLLVVLKNGYKDYVSRRQLKTVKERIGFRL